MTPAPGQDSTVPGIHPPVEATQAGALFFDSALRTLQLFNFVVRTALAIAYGAYIAKRALDKVDGIAQEEDAEEAKTSEGLAALWFSAQFCEIN